MTLGERIKIARKTLALSQATLADAVGVNQSVISDLERGVTQDPGAETLVLIAHELRVSAHHLLFGTDKPKSEPELEVASLASEEAEDQQALLRLYVRLSPGHKRVLQATARALRDSERKDTLTTINAKDSAA